MPLVSVPTFLVVRELTTGDSLVALAGDPSRASFGDEEDAILEARMFLQEHLARAAPDVVTRFALPEGSRLVTTDVVIPKDDLPRRAVMTVPIRIPSLVLPTPVREGEKEDVWVHVLPLFHTFFVPDGEELHEAIASEVKRVAAARALDASAYLSLLPARDERLLGVTVEITRGADAATLARVGNARKRLAELEAKKNAMEILASVADRFVPSSPPSPFPLREDELASLGAVLGGTARSSVLVVGPARVGKSGLLRAWLERESEANRARPVFVTSGARLVAGMSGFGQWQERVRRVMEAASLVDAILWFDDLADLFSDRPGGYVDIPSAMRRWLDDGQVRVVGEVREDVLERLEPRDGGFFSCFGRVRLEPGDARTATAVLEALRLHAEKRSPGRPRIAPSAIGTLVELASRFLPYTSFPGKAVLLAEEMIAAEELRLGTEARSAVLGPEEVVRTFSVKTGVPSFLLRDSEALRVADVEASLAKRVVGQEHAVRRVAELVAVVKAGLAPGDKPLATLLFVGPTGVGKTELARALAELLFGDEERLVRFDMSEYADPWASDRLFRGQGGGEGLLTRRVREQPFSVVLLDEIEKAHPAVFDLLLQVAGEGRLTDGRGRTAFFHNTLLVMTSNLGASHRRASVGYDKGAADDERHYLKAVRETFRPEMVNRIDRIVSFRPLTPDEALAVAKIVTRRLTARAGIVERGIEVVVSDAALARLAADGISDTYGARALRRYIERTLGTPIARLVAEAKGGLEGCRIRVEAEPALTFSVERRKDRRSAFASDQLARIMRIRRRMQKQLAMDAVTEQRDQRDNLVTQLGYGQDRKRKKNEEQVEGRVLGQMQGDHARLAGILDPLDAAFGDACGFEELALDGYLAGSDLAPLLAEIDLARRTFEGRLVQALVAGEVRRNAATFMLSELDGERALDVWLPPFLAHASRARWSVEVHVDGGARDPGSTWPAERRWGPPRTPAWASEAVVAEGRSFRHVLLRIDGEGAAIWPGLEVGVTALHGLHPSGKTALLGIQLVALRAQLAESEWKPAGRGGGIDPPNPEVAETRAKAKAARECWAHGTIVRVRSRESHVNLPYAAYWERHAEIALAHLLLRDEDPEAFGELLLQPLLDETFPEVRSELRKGNKIGAIKLYRELTGLGLKEAKDAVEGMG